jgi:CBS domain-containing protein
VIAICWAAAERRDDRHRAPAERQIRRIPVIESHRLVGMISEADLAGHLPEQ